LYKLPAAITPYPPHKIRLLEAQFLLSQTF
jgi:hypothetical protein